MVEHDTWEKREALENARETLEEFEEKINVEMRKQEKLDMAEERDFRRGELLWQPLDTKSNSSTTSKFLSRDI